MLRHLGLLYDMPELSENKIGAHITQKFIDDQTPSNRHLKDVIADNLKQEMRRGDEAAKQVQVLLSDSDTCRGVDREALFPWMYSTEKGQATKPISSRRLILDSVRPDARNYVLKFKRENNGAECWFRVSTH